MSTDKGNPHPSLPARGVCCTTVLPLRCGCYGCSPASCRYASSSSPSSQVEASCCQREGDNGTGRACASRRVISSKPLRLTVVWREHWNRWQALGITFSKTSGRPMVCISLSFLKPFVPWATLFTLFFEDLRQRKGHETDWFSCQQCSSNMLLYTTHFQMRQSLNLLEIRRPLSLRMKERTTNTELRKDQNYAR